MIGKTVSHYKIIEKLGEGGKGVVYKAEDLKLNRFVALKFFPSNQGIDEMEEERFIQEAKAASSLDHENICTVHEIGKTEDDRIFICMAYYKGETLMEKIKYRPLKLDNIIDFSVQIARGMEKAHQKGIVHRDIKPHNIVITDEGIVKIVDFGMVKLAGQKKLTREGVLLGTVTYMSPEQARGETVDHRTDIWSFGVVMYEMITGLMPFRSEYFETVILSILNEEPELITSLRSGIPLELERIVNKCLSKDSSDRYQHFDELIVDLNRLKKKENLDAATYQNTGRYGFPKKPVLQSIILGSILVLILFFMTRYFLIEKRDPERSSKDITSMSKSEQSIAIFPFKNLNQDQEQEYFCDGIVEELIYALYKVESLKVYAPTSIFQSKEKDFDVRMFLEKLKVQYRLDGSVHKVGSLTRTTAKLLRVSDSYVVWSGEYTRNMKDILAIRDEISLAIVDTLKIKLIGTEKAKLVKHPTENFEAFKLYVKGRHSWNQRTPKGLTNGIKLFREAIENDPDYALAYVGLADSFHMSVGYSSKIPKEAFPRAKKAAKKALELDNMLGEAYNSLAAINLFYDWDFSTAGKGFKRAIKLNPNSNLTYEWYAIYLTVINHTDEAVKVMRKAAELDPFSTSSQTGPAIHLYFAGKFDQAIEEFRRVFNLKIKLDASLFYARTYFGLTYIQKKMYKEAFIQLKIANDLVLGQHPAIIAVLGYAYAISGNQKEAYNKLNNLLKMSAQTYIQSIYIATVYTGLRDNDKAFEWLEKAYDERSEWLVYLKVEHLFKPLRDDPRFAALVKKVGLK